MSGRGAVAVLALAALVALVFVFRGEPETDAGGPAPTAPTGAHGMPARRGGSRGAGTTAGDSSSGDATSALVVRVVADEDGAPLAGATVAASHGKETLRATCDADGTARFERLAPSDWNLLASAASRAPAESTATVGDGVMQHEMRLARAVALSLRVEDFAGAPVPDAAIELDVVHTQDSIEATTDEDGERLLLVAADRTVRVLASATGFGSATTALRTPATGMASAVLRLARLGRVRGVVRTRDGDPVPDARVTVAPAPLLELDAQSAAFFGAQGQVQVTSGPDGAYVAEGIVPGRCYRALAESPLGDWVSSAVEDGVVVGSDRPEALCDLTLRRAARLDLHLVGADGAPTSDATVIVFDGRMAAGFPVADGTARITRLRPGGYLVFVQTKETTVARPFSAAEGDATQATLRLVPDAVRRGRVVDEEGRGVPSARVEIGGNRRAALFGAARATTDTDGWFRAPLSDFAGEASSLTVSAEGFVTLHGVAVPDGDRDILLTMRRAATVTFRLRNADGSAFTNAAYVAVGAGPPVRHRATDADGRFCVPCDPAGPTNVRIVVAGDSAPVAASATLQGGTTVDLGDLTIAKPRTVRGRVVDAAGRGIAGATVRPDADDWAPEGSKTDRNGAFEIWFAPLTGLVPLRVEADGFVPLRCAPDVGSDLLLTMARGGVVWGEVVDALDLPFERAVLRLTDAAGTELPPPVADPHGRFLVRLPAGRYSLRADGGEFVSFDLTEGGETHVRLAGKRP